MATNPNPTLKFSRRGQQLGDYKLLQVKEAMNLGRLLPTDHYWMPGMSEWKLLSEVLPKLDKLIASLAPAPAPVPTAFPAVPTADLPIIATTTYTVEGHRIVQYMGIVRGLMVRSPNVFEGLGGAIDGIFGGKQGSYMGMCEKTRAEAYEAMAKNAKGMGANAVIGIAYDTTEIMERCTEVLCYGTAVFIEPIPGQAR